VHHWLSKNLGIEVQFLDRISQSGGLLIKVEIVLNLAIEIVGRETQQNTTKLKHTKELKTKSAKELFYLKRCTSTQFVEVQNGRLQLVYYKFLLFLKKVFHRCRKIDHEITNSNKKRINHSGEGLLEHKGIEV